MADAEPKPVCVNPDARYISGWNEINARIAQRQHLLTIYLSVVLAATGASAANATFHNLWRCLYAIPAASVVFALLLLMHERQIAVLRVFLAELEEMPTPVRIPGFHGGGRLGVMAQKVRRIHDFCCAILIVGMHVVGTMLWLNAYAEGLTTPADAVCGVILLIAGGYALLRVIFINRERQKLSVLLRGTPYV